MAEETIAQTAIAPPAEEEVLCPMCDYNLRGLTEQRCPECGRPFVWEDLRDPARRLHPYLFEHHPEANVWSFYRTVLGGWRPWRFWTKLLPSQPSRPRRLVLYWGIYTLLLLLAVAGRYLFDVAELRQQMNMQRTAATAYFKNPAVINSKYAQQLIQQYGSVQAYIDATSPAAGPELYSRATGGPSSNWYSATFIPPAYNLSGLLGAMLAWPWIATLAFQIFQFTMARVRIRSSHVMRACIYSADAFLAMPLLTLPALVINLINPAPYGSVSPSNEIFYRLALLSPVIGMLIFTFRLWIACKKYLRFDHALATIISVQIIVALSIPVSIITLHAIFELLGWI